MQTPIFDYVHSYTNTLKLRTISASGSVLAVLLTIAAVTADRPLQRWVLFGSALGVTQVSRLASGARAAQDRINQDYTDISDASRQQVLFQTMTATKSEAPVLELVDGLDVSLLGDGPEELDKFDLTKVSKENHLAVVGSSGSGKTILAQWLIMTAYPSGTDVAIYDTDASPNDWQGRAVVGRGGDDGSIELAMLEDLDELQLRTERRSVGEPLGKSIVRVVEEFPSLSADIGDRATKAADNTALNWLKRLLRRGRKYGMGVLLVSQEFEVEALGIKGQGNLRNAFTIIYLGKQALKQLDSVRDKTERQQLRAYLTGSDRPCLVEVGGQYLVADVPDLSDFADELEDYQADDEDGDTAGTLDILDTTADIGDESHPTAEHLDEPEGDGGYLPRVPAMPARKAAGNTLVIPMEPMKFEDNSGAVALTNGDSIPTLNARYLHKVIAGHLVDGLSKSVIIKKQLKYTGRKYQVGLELWDKLTEKFGSFDAP